MSKRNLFLAAALIVLVGGAAAAVFYTWKRPAARPLTEPSVTVDFDTGASISVTGAVQPFGAGVTYSAASLKIDPAVAADFDIAEIANIADMERAYGFSFTSEEMAALASRKFVVKPLLETAIRPSSGRDNAREFVQLYDLVKGDRDPRGRAPENAVFYSSDVFFNAYSNLFTELLKELENGTFYPAMRSLSETFYRDAADKAAAASTDAERLKWSKVRNYFAVPYAVFSTVKPPLKESDYFRNGTGLADPAVVAAEHQKADDAIDSYENVASFVESLGLGEPDQEAVLADLKTIFEAEGKATPQVFAEEYAKYAQIAGIDLKVDFSQFTPRGTYTSSSLRRQYFRGMKWFIMVPFFLKSPELTTYAFAASQLLAEHPEALRDYNSLESAIGFMVGKSDDLMPADYLQALLAARGTDDPAAVAMGYLERSRDPQIKDLAAFYPSIGSEQSDEVRLKTKGMRFFSGKFIIDSYWTGYLTQGDEAPRPGYTQKLPPMASALEVMALLGSDYARSLIPTLDFYNSGNSEAINQAMAELDAENGKLTEADWTQNLYTAWLWSVKGLFGWLSDNRSSLPRFMQSADWEAKTLQTAAAWWTELRHATILYAKQSFAELGAGMPDCDERIVPPPPKAYIEPQAEAYARLSYLAKRTHQGLKDQGYELRNLQPLESLIELLDAVRKYVGLQLANAALQESVVSDTSQDSSDPSRTCLTYSVTDSDWETMRVGIVDGLKAALPVPIEGPVLSAKDRRAALVADVHTGGDSSYQTSILYEGTGVPHVMFAAVSDANGPRLTVGFISSHYEFTELYGGQRLTDEGWQKRFYVGDQPYDAFNYTDATDWPTPPEWYRPLFR